MLDWRLLNSLRGQDLEPFDERSRPNVLIEGRKHHNFTKALLSIYNLNHDLR